MTSKGHDLVCGFNTTYARSMFYSYCPEFFTCSPVWCINRSESICSDGKRCHDKEDMARGTGLWPKRVVANRVVARGIGLLPGERSCGQGNRPREYLELNMKYMQA